MAWVAPIVDHLSHRHGSALFAYELGLQYLSTHFVGHFRIGSIEDGRKQSTLACEGSAMKTIGQWQSIFHFR